MHETLNAPHHRPPAHRTSDIVETADLTPLDVIDIRVMVEKQGSPHTIASDALLLATGRRPIVESLIPEAAGGRLYPTNGLGVRRAPDQWYIRNYSPRFVRLELDDVV